MAIPDTMITIAVIYCNMNMVLFGFVLSLYLFAIIKKPIIKRSKRKWEPIIPRLHFFKTGVSKVDVKANRKIFTMRNGIAMIAK